MTVRWRADAQDGKGKGGGETFVVQTDGVNFDAAWQPDSMIDVNKIMTNDVAAILRCVCVRLRVC